METFMILAGVLGLIGEIISTITTNAQNKQIAEEQLAKQQNFAHNEAILSNQRAIENYQNYQSPAAQVQQLKDAGLSVGMFYGGSHMGGVNTTPAASAPSVGLPVMQNPSSAIKNLFENIKTMTESTNIGEDTEKKKAEINKLNSDIETNNATITKIATENNLTKVLEENSKLDGILKQIEIEINNATKENRIKTVSAELKNIENQTNKLLEEIASLKIDNENKDALQKAAINKTKAETTLIWKQVIKTEQETLMVEATTALTTEQTNLTFTERQKLYKEIEQLRKINAKIEAEIKLIEAETNLTNKKKISEIIGWISSATDIASDISSIMLRVK